MTFAELKAQFTALLNRTDTTTALKDLFVNMAQLRAQRELKIPAQETLSTTVVADPFTGITVPAGLKQVITITSDDEPLEYLPHKQFLALGNDQTGTPSYWTRINGKFQFFPTPPVAAVIEIYYFGEFTAFTTDGGTTSISISDPDLIIYGALSYAADYYIDERATTFEARYAGIRDTITDQASLVDGATTVQAAYQFGDD